LVVVVYEIGLLLRRYHSRAPGQARSNAASQDWTEAEDILADWRVPIMATVNTERRSRYAGEGRLIRG
jgi:hypothetical protein